MDDVTVMNDPANTPATVTTGDRLDLLMAAARAGNAAAYRDFLGEAAQRLRATLARKIGGDAELEDLVQEALIACHEKRHTLDPARPVAPWLTAIARYKLIDHWRKRGRNPVVLAEADGEIAASGFAHVDVASLLDRLPEAQAEAIRLTHLEGLTGSEAADRVGIGLSAMKLRVHRGMLRLKNIVDGKE